MTMPGNGTPFDNYNITVTLTDDDGGADSAADVVTVNNVAPSVTGQTFSDPAMLGNVDLQLFITDAGYDWFDSIDIDWGDGQTESFIGISPQSETVWQSHYYSAGSGTFTITVTVTDDDLGTSAALLLTVTLSGGCSDPVLCP
jgi:hypothetical protein